MVAGRPTGTGSSLREQVMGDCITDQEYDIFTVRADGEGPNVELRAIISFWSRRDSEGKPGVGRSALPGSHDGGGVSRSPVFVNYASADAEQSVGPAARR